MIEIKLYLYDRTKENSGLGGYRGTDLSKYVAQGFGDKEDITQELDTSDITLYGYPQQKEFDPETKFIIDIVENGQIVETLHRVVQKDLVNQPELVDDGYFDHHISLIEPSAIAQKRLVDNISATYKLKDVTLEEEVAYNLNEDATMTNQSSSYTPQNNFGYSRSVHFMDTDYVWRWGKYFEYEGDIEILDASGQPQDPQKKYRDLQDFLDNGNYYAQFRIPKLAIYGGLNNSKNFAKIGYASLDWKVEEFTLTDSYNPTNTWNGSFISNSNLGSNSNYYVPYSEEVGTQTFKNEWLLETYDYSTDSLGQFNGRRIKKYTDTTQQNAPTYLTTQIPIVADRQYVITVSIHEFDDNLPVENSYAKNYTGSPSLYVERKENRMNSGNALNSKSLTIDTITNKQSQITTSFVTYAVNLGRLVLSSSVPYSALALLQKAVMNSTIYEKTDGVYIADINNNDVPFYVDPNFINELSETKIIENFYNQKNLWEILIEVGNYIHAVPEIKFGQNDRFLITFNRLGITDQSENKSQKMTIMNSKGLEDYISACSSYVTNMVQLGGTIEEWVAPKTTDETYLVSNDTADIVVSKPIIELLEIRVRCDVADGSGITAGTSADMTPYVYEENVYKTLSLDKNLNPNRGIAMYYSLGDNKIVGGNYQLPRANTDAYTQYAIKKIIYSAFDGYSASYGTTAAWNNIKVNNYSFFVKYRTKDSVRQNHTRPDLRKYLLSSYFDKVPQHNQFNNQQDVVVDSIKFGNNMYGKLIRTGNSNYKVTEWNSKYDNIKHKGELYRIGGDLYYVANANHIFYANHIISEIEYSKDYNQLSPIIGIPSEPRFYEISEQSLIWREVAIDDYLLITDDEDNLEIGGGYINDYSHLAELLFVDGTTFSKYAITTYKGDKDIGSYDQTLGDPNFYVDVLSPINAYSSENTLTYEWDMTDNFSAGDKVVAVSPNQDETDTDKWAYRSLKAVQYTDIFGKAALFDFYILGDIPTLTTTEIQALPESPIITNDPTQTNYVGNYEILAGNVKEDDGDYNGRGLGLLKDCREALSLNYNLQAITTSDTFVLSPFFYLPNKENVRIVLLSEEVNKLSNGYINTASIITPLDTNNQPMSQTFSIIADVLTRTDGWGNTVWGAFGLNFNVLNSVNVGHFTNNENYQRVKAIAVVCDVSLDVGSGTEAPTTPNKTQFILARNIPSDWSKAQATASWLFGSPNQTKIFKNRQ